ncbi:MAG: toll/interleukin-1 receptor domain-containing protein [Alphaproteobacteria bacterium]|nr:toll/interleukin-1 receptor domain-containing protein [Alphaproteobacteria bacterium]MBO6863564.1 toll/interleukin-1 receptor domain-containing protein [Alphaproteobacteria bacterium]
MARCTAPVYGHRTAGGEAACPVCGPRRRFAGYSTYSRSSYSSGSSFGSGGGGQAGFGGASSRSKPSWSPASSTVVYSPLEIQALTPVRRSVENRDVLPEGRDVFLCHAWDDRAGAAKELHDQLESKGVSVWFSEKDVALGTTLLREIDKGLARSRVGLVLVTPALLERLRQASIADKELSALLARELLVPVVHKTTYDALRDESPLLASRTGLSTEENSMEEVAAKIAELVAV